MKRMTNFDLVYDIESKKLHFLKVAIFTATILLSGFLLGGCSNESGKVLELPTWGNLERITWQEYEFDVPVSVEMNYPIFTSRPNSTFFYNPGYNDWKQITKEKDLPDIAKRIGFKFTEKNGNTTFVYAYQDSEYDYLEIPDEGVWRKAFGHGNTLRFYFDEYQEEAFKYVFEKMAVNHHFSLVDNYNNSDKAVFLEKNRNGEFVTTKQHLIPEDMIASRPEDVRYVIYEEYVGESSALRVIERGTGKDLGLTSAAISKLTAYDLVSGETELLKDASVDRDYDRIEEYLINKNNAAN